MKLKKLTLVFVMILFAGAMYSQQTEDEQALDQAIQSVQQNRPQNQTQTTSGDESGTVITTTTVTTTIVVTNYVTEESPAVQNRPVEQTTPPDNTGVVEIAINSRRPIGVGTLILAESMGICIPGFGLSHFILGDTRGGRTALIITGVSLLTYFGAEIAIETRAIDDPDVYSAIHYASMGLFLASYLYDVIGAPIYYKNYNLQCQPVTVYVKPLDVEYRDYRWDTDETAVQFLNVGLRF